MIFVPDKNEKWHDEFKTSLSRYFKYLPFDYDNYSKVIRNLNDTFFIQMPASNNLRQSLGVNGHHEKEVIKPGIEFFYKLCSNKNSSIRLSDQRRVVLFSTEEFNNILPNITSIPPCFTKIPFSVEAVIKKKIISDDNCCDRCEWGSKLIKYRNIVYHIKRMNEIRSIDEIEAKFVKEDFISNIDDIEESLTKLFPVNIVDPKNETVC